MKRLVTALFLSGCHIAILHPQWAEQPRWAVDQCGPQPVMCSNGACCPKGHECSVDRVPSMYASKPDDGYCRWQGDW